MSDGKSVCLSYGKSGCYLMRECMFFEGKSGRLSDGKSGCLWEEWVFG